MPRKAKTPHIYVLAGTDGAGKSSIAGAMLIAECVEYFNLDDAAELILVASPGITLAESQSAAWDEGRRLLERAINEHLDYAFETTLGGRTIPALLEKAAKAGIEVRIWYVGLTNAELHTARVHARVKRGGHDIPEERIRQRYARSILNLIQLMPRLTELRVYDNSGEADPHTGATPEPGLIVHLNRGKLLNVCELTSTPEWAKPIVLRALTLRL